MRREARPTAIGSDFELPHTPRSLCDGASRQRCVLFLFHFRSFSGPRRSVHIERMLQIEAVEHVPTFSRAILDGILPDFLIRILLGFIPGSARGEIDRL